MSEPNVNAIPSARAAGRSRTHKVTVTAMLSAVAFVLMFIEFPIPALIPAFVKLDISDLPELLAAFSLGPVYRRNKSRRGALLGAVIGTLLMAVLSVPLNYFVVYPAYVVCYHLPLETIIGMYQAIRPSVDGLLECLLVFNMPFTFFKGLLDVALCFLIYKPLSPLLHK